MSRTSRRCKLRVCHKSAATFCVIWLREHNNSVRYYSCCSLRLAVRHFLATLPLTTSGCALELAVSESLTTSSRHYHFRAWRRYYVISFCVSQALYYTSTRCCWSFEPGFRVCIFYDIPIMFRFWISRLKLFTMRSNASRARFIWFVFFHLFQYCNKSRIWAQSHEWIFSVVKHFFVID